MWQDLGKCGTEFGDKKKTDASRIGLPSYRLFTVGNGLFVHAVIAAAAGLNDFEIAVIVIAAAAIAITVAVIVIAAAIAITVASTAAESAKLIAEDVAKQCNNADKGNDPEDHAKDSSGLLVHNSTTSLN